MRQLLNSLIGSPLFTAANAFAGVYAMMVWGFLAIVRVRTRQWFFAIIDFQLMICAGVVGMAYTMAAFDLPDARIWLSALRVVVTPLIVFPSLLILTHYRQLRRVVGSAKEAVEGFAESREGEAGR